MCLLEFECAKRLKAHSRAIPEINNKPLPRISQFTGIFMLCQGPISQEIYDFIIQMFKNKNQIMSWKIILLNAS